MIFKARIPTAPLFLGMAGLLPFLWGVGTLWSEDLFRFTLNNIGPRFVGPFVILQYGTVILAFMAGVLWGFATKAEGSVAASGYALSVLPALWAWFFVGDGPTSSAIYLMVGFVGLLAIDWMFWRQGLAPPWWMALRIGLTSVVVVCLIAVVI
ncbi:MAG: DUF3429 domain-containing protein [Pseudomonadota bacterium]